MPIPAIAKNQKTHNARSFGRMGYTMAASILIGISIIAIRVALAFEVGSIMLLAMVIIMPMVTRLSPPLASLTFLYGWVLFGQMDFQGLPIFPRIPTITILMTWTMMWLLHWRRVDGSLKSLARPIVIIHLVLISAFFTVGSAGALLSGTLSNPLVRFFIWDIFRSWMGYLVVGMLGCSNLKDLRIMLIGLPFGFLCYPLSLPLEAWRDFLGYGLVLSEVLGVGLSYGSLNTNTLGQAAAIASVAAAAVIWTSRRPLLRLMMVALFFICGGITVMTAARQAIISWVAGLFVIGILLGSWRSILSVVVLALCIYIVGQVAISRLYEGSGFETRLLELTQSPETWASRSYTTRQGDMLDAVEKWSEAPLFGVGFGGQSFHVIESVNEVTGEYSSELHGTHNFFLGILAQTGIAGFILFLAFVLDILWRFLQITRSVRGIYRDDARLLRIAFLAIFVGIFIQQNISGGLGLGSRNLIFLLGALLGVIGTIQMGTKERERYVQGHVPNGMVAQ